jgi:hypothetical protein
MAELREGTGASERKDLPVSLLGWPQETGIAECILRRLKEH